MKYSENKPQPKGLTSETTKKLSHYFKENFNSYLSEGYLEFLNIMNGFSYDGHSIFCCYNDEIESNYPRYSSLDLATFDTQFYANTDTLDYIILEKSSIDYIGLKISM